MICGVWAVIFFACLAGLIVMLVKIDDLHARGAFGKTRDRYLFANKLKKAKP